MRVKKIQTFVLLWVTIFMFQCSWFKEKPKTIPEAEPELSSQEERIKALEEELGRLEENYNLYITEQFQKLAGELDKIKQLIDLLKLELEQNRKQGKDFRPFIPDDFVFCNEKVPLDRFGVRERLEFAILNELERQGMVLAILRSGRWFPVIEQKIRESGLPEDLKYIAVIESYLHPGAVSSANAVGIWQFIKNTAKHAGLKVNSHIDERYDSEKATEAALKHLAELYSEFGDWPSALAGYNMHKDRYAKEKAKERAGDFYDVKDIPLETQRYPFRAMAAKLIMEYPQKYGFPLFEDLNKVKYAPYPVEARMVDVAKSERIIEIAKRLGMTYYEFRVLNPHIRSSLPRGKYKIYIKKTE